MWTRRGIIFNAAEAAMVKEILASCESLEQFEERAVFIYDLHEAMQLLQVQKIMIFIHILTMIGIVSFTIMKC